jgi:HEAT repeat protein
MLHEVDFHPEFAMAEVCQEPHEIAAEYLDHPSPAVRIWAMRVWRQENFRLKNPDQFKQLRSMLLDPSLEVGGIAASALEFLPSRVDPGQLNFLSDDEWRRMVEIACSSDVSSSSRQGALRLLKRDKSLQADRVLGLRKAAGSALEEVSSSKNREVTSTARFILLSLREHAAYFLPELEQKYRSDPSLRKRIYPAIELLDPAKAKELKNEYEQEDLELSSEGIDFGKPDENCQRILAGGAGGP